MQAETIHIWLMVGQYVLLPLVYWIAKKVKESIVSELKAHVDQTMAAHEAGESTKFQELNDRVGRIETVLMTRGVPKVASRRRVGKSA